MIVGERFRTIERIKKDINLHLDCDESRCKKKYYPNLKHIVKQHFAFDNRNYNIKWVGIVVCVCGVVARIKINA